MRPWSHRFLGQEEVGRILTEGGWSEGFRWPETEEQGRKWLKRPRVHVPASWFPMNSTRLRQDWAVWSTKNRRQAVLIAVFVVFPTDPRRCHTSQNHTRKLAVLSDATATTTINDSFVTQTPTNLPETTKVIRRTHLFSVNSGFRQICEFYLRSSFLCSIFSFRPL